MLQGLVDGDAGRGIELQQLAEEVEGERIGPGKELLEIVRAPLGLASEELASLGAGDPLHLFVRGGSEKIQHKIELVGIYTFPAWMYCRFPRRGACVQAFPQRCSPPTTRRLL